MEENKYMQLRQNTVIKANELIQKSRFNLTLQQQRIVLYLISQITPFDEHFKLYEFSIQDFCKVCGLDYNNGQNYELIRNAIKGIRDQSIKGLSADGKYETDLAWIEKPYYSKQSGIIKIRLDEDMKPYLLQLKQNFTQYELFWTLKFKSKYSIRLYELIKSIHYNEMELFQRTFELDELKHMLGAETYPTYQKVKDRVLVPAIQEINQYSDKWVSYAPVKQGRAVTKIQLTISTKKASERLQLQEHIEKEFHLDQLSLFQSADNSSSENKPKFGIIQG